MTHRRPHLSTVQWHFVHISHWGHFRFLAGHRQCPVSLDFLERTGNLNSHNSNWKKGGDWAGTENTGIYPGLKHLLAAGTWVTHLTFPNPFPRFQRGFFIIFINCWTNLYKYRALVEIIRGLHSNFPFRSLSQDCFPTQNNNKQTNK